MVSSQHMQEDFDIMGKKTGIGFINKLVLPKNIFSKAYFACLRFRAKGAVL